MDTPTQAAPAVNANITEADVRAFIAAHMREIGAADITLHCYATNEKYTESGEGWWLVSRVGEGIIGSGKTMQAAVNNARTKLHNKAERAALKRKQAEQLLAEAEQLSKEAA